MWCDLWCFMKVSTTWLLIQFEHNGAVAIPVTSIILSTKLLIEVKHASCTNYA